MFRKLMKKCYLLVAVLLMVGGICLLPSRIEENIDGSPQPGVSKAIDITSGNKYGQSGVYFIPGDKIVDSANPGNTQNVYGGQVLGEIARSINAGEEKYKSATFVLEGDIDLSGQFWTPIGTAANPFKGVFYGDGYRISNIVIDEKSIDGATVSMSNQYLGLFGYVDGATIADLRISGSQIYNVSTTPAAYGTLVGRAVNSAIINCYEESANRKITIGTSAPADMKSIGGMASTSVYKGNSYRGTTETTSSACVDANSLTTGFVATFTVSKPTYSGVNAAFGFYKVNGEKAEEFYNPLPSGDTKGIRVLLNPSGQIDSSSPSKASIFLKSTPVERSKATTGNVFALKEGYQVTIPTHASAQLCSTTQVEAYQTVTIDGGYGGEAVGERRKVTLSQASKKYPYNMSFLTYFSLHTGYVRRLGYTFNGIYSTSKVKCDFWVNKSDVCSTLNADEGLPVNFKTQFPDADATYNIEWARDASVSRGFTVRFVMANDEGGKFLTNFAMVESVTGLTLGSSVDTASEKYRSYTIGTVGTNDQYAFSVTIRKGYRINITQGQNVANNESVKADVKSNMNSGAYVCYKNASGKDDGYLTAAKNYDSYNPTYITGTWNKNDWESNNNIDKNYSFTVGNIVGQSGIIYLVVERDWLTIDITPTTNAAVTGASGNLSYNMTLFDSKTASDTTTNTFLYYFCWADASGNETGKSSTISAPNQEGKTKAHLKVRRGESPTVKVEMLDYYIITISEQTMTSPIDNGPTGETSDIVKTDGSIKGAAGYYPNWLFTIQFGDADYAILNSQHKLTLVCGSLQTKVKVQLFKEGGDALTDNNEVTGLVVFINPSNFQSNMLPSSNDQGITNGEKLFNISASGTDNIYVSKNGKYEAKNFELFDSEGGKITIAQATFQDEGLLSGVAPYKFWSSGVGSANTIFKNAVDDEGHLNYTLKVYFAERKFNVTFKYRVTNGTTTTEITAPKSLLFSTVPADVNSHLPGAINNISFALSTIGKGVLHYTGVELSGENIFDGPKSSSTISLNEDESENGTFIFNLSLGYYNTTVTFNFSYRLVNFTISKLHFNNKDIDNAMDIIEKTFRFAYREEEGQGKLALETTKIEGKDGSVISKILIDSQYYLLGWYISGHDEIKISGALDSFMTNDQALAVIATAGSSGNIETTEFGYTGLMPLVALRTVSVNYNAGQAGKGKLYSDDKTSAISDNTKKSAASIQWDVDNNLSQKISLSNDIFFNVGHTFKEYSHTVGSIDESNNFSLSVEDFSTIFGAGGGKRTTWTAFVDPSNDTALMSGVIDLIAQWQMIEYKLQIDDKTIIVIKVGDKITYTIPAETSSDYKKGFANYTITDGTTNSAMASQTGSDQIAHVVIGYKIYQASAATNKTNNTAGSAYILSAEDLYTILSADYRFAVNDDAHPIRIETLREPAKYYLILSPSPYYTYTWSGSADVGFKDTDGSVKLIVTYGQKPINPQTLIASETLSVKRNGANGYTCNGWVVGANGEQSEEGLYNFENPYTQITDITLVPTWERDTQTTTKSKMEKTADAASKDTFRLGYEHDIFNGLLDGGNVKQGDLPSNARINNMLYNGEYIESYRFSITFGGETYEVKNKEVLNLSDLNKGAGKYRIKFIIVVKDGLNKGSRVLPTYEAACAEWEVTLEQNVIYFFNYSLHTTYTGTSEFVATNEGEGEGKVNNNFGSFLYQYDWDNTDLSKSPAAIGLVEEYFNNFSVVGDSAGFNAGSGKTLKMQLNLDKLGAGKDYSVIFSNVTKEGSKYYTQIENDLTIEKAKFSITFPRGSAYAIPGVETIICENLPAAQFKVGSVIFVYNCSKITLKATKPDGSPFETGDWRGQANHKLDSDTFNVYGLVIKDHESELDTNFEWNISPDSVFTLLDTNNALTFNYSVAYLTATNGIKNALANSYQSVADTIRLRDVMINSQAQEVKNDTQGSFFFEEVVSAGTSRRAYLAYYYNDKDNILTIYIDKDLLNRVPLSYSLDINVSAQRQQSLMFLALVSKSISDADVDKLFDNSNTSQYKFNVSPKSSDKAGDYQMLFTDVVKTHIDYNGGYGTRGGNEVQEETVYLSATESGAIEIPTPTYKYDGIKFKSYLTQESSRLSITDITNGKKFKSTKGGQKEEVKVQWTFEQFLTKENSLTVSRKASKTALTIPLEEMVTVTLPTSYKSGIITATRYTLAKAGGLSFVAVSDSFTVKDEKGYAPTAIGGSYTLTLTVTFTDGIGEVQTKTKTFNINLNVTINNLDVEHSGDLVFNNAKRDNDITLKFTVNKDDEPNKSSYDNILGALPKTDNTSNASNVYVSYGNIELVDTYEITVTIESQYQDIYKFDGTQITKTLTIKVTKFIIHLGEKKYLDQIRLSKSFGSEDPSPIKTQINIAENNGDSVVLIFDRTDKSNEIGEYALTFNRIESDDDARNYDVDTAGFNSKFTIVRPGGNIKIELSSYLTYVYNGQTLSSISATYESNDTYKLSGMAGETEVSTTFKMYYTDKGTGKNISIPESERATYATKYLVFAINNPTKFVKEYTFTVSLANEAKGTTEKPGLWDGVEFVSNSLAKVVVTKRTLTVLNATKVFDGDNTLTFNTKNSDTNNCTITLQEGVEGQCLVAGDEVIISGNIAGNNSHRRGTYSLTGGISITGGTEGSCYELKFAPDAQTVVTPSKIKVTLSGIAELVYGEVTSSGEADKGIFTTTKLNELKNKLLLVYDGGALYNGGTIRDESFVVTKIEIEGATFSTGEYLNVTKNNEGKYVFKITVTSKDFTFEDNDDTREEYTHEYTIEVKINQKTLNISNSTNNPITKEFDGTANLPTSLIGQLVGQSQGNLVADDLLPGDKLKVVGGNYNDDTIANNKSVTITLGEDDHENYAITWNNIVGSITARVLYFNKVITPTGFEFVNDGVTDLANDGQFSISYGDNSTDTLIDNILKVANFATRTGYTQTGYKYDGKSLTEIKKDPTLSRQLLEAAVAKGTSGLDLDVIWEKNDITVTVNALHTKISWSGKTSLNTGDDLTTLDGSEQIIINAKYFDSFADISLKVDAGYKIVKIENEFLEKKEGEATRTGKFSLKEVRKSTVINVDIQEILIVINLDYSSQGSAFSLKPVEGYWNGATRKSMSYSDLIKTENNLPFPHTEGELWAFTGWLLDGKPNDGATIWERIGGTDLQKDGEFTFKATWELGEFTLTITSIHTTEIKVNVNGEDLPTNVPGEHVYTLHYTDDPIISIKGDAFYKYDRRTITGNYVSVTEGVTHEGIYDKFTITDISTDINVNIVYVQVSIVIKTTATAREGSQIDSPAAGSISATYRIEDIGTTTLDQFFKSNSTPKTDRYICTAGTYTQKGWTYDGKADVYKLDEELDLQELIKTLLGYDPYKDEEITLDAYFEGDMYTVTFVLGEDFADSTFINSDSGKSTTRQIRYGDVLQTKDIPVFAPCEGEFIWAIQDAEENIETFTVGSTFVSTSFISPEHTMTLTAKKGKAFYIIKFDIRTNKDKLNQILLDGVKVEDAGVQLINGATKSFTFDLSTGYTINETTIDAGDLNYKVTKNTERNKEIFQIIKADVEEDEITIVIEIIPKEYTITFSVSDYEKVYDVNKATITETKIKYDQAGAEVFGTNITYGRGGYRIAKLIVSRATDVFATYTSETEIEYNSTYFTEKSGKMVYTWDGDLTVKIVWQLKEDEKYIDVTPTLVGGEHYYNEKDQEIVNSVLYENGKKVELNVVLTNGEKITEIYYIVKGARLPNVNTIENFALIYKNAIKETITVNITVVDSLLNTASSNTRTVSTEIEIEIKKANVVILDSDIEGYYTGSPFYWPTTDYNYGSLIYYTKSIDTEPDQVTYLSVEKVEFVDETGAFSVKTGNKVKYYFNQTPSFDISNYEGLEIEGSFITYTTDAMREDYKVYGDIVKAQIVLTFKESGYFNEKTQTIQEFSQEIKGGSSEFVVTVTSITTKLPAIGEYKLTSDFDFAWTLTRNGVDAEDLKSNFEFTFSSDTIYSIVSTDNAYKVTFDAQYFNVETPQLETVTTDDVVRIRTYLYEGKELQTAQDGTFNYFDEDGSLIMTVTGNGQKGLFVWITNGKSIEFGLSAVGKLHVLKWSNKDADTAQVLKNLLEHLEVEELKEKSIKVENTLDYVGVLTDYKAVMRRYKDKGEDAGFVYIKIDDTIDVPEGLLWTGFTFTHWDLSASGLELREAENKLYCPANHNILATHIDAVFEISDPDVEGQDYSFKAHLEKSGDAAYEKVLFTSVWKDGDVRNRNNDYIAYNYIVRKEGNAVTTLSDGFSVLANTTSNGIYTMVVRAARNGYATKEKTITFNLTVIRLTLNSLSINKEEFTYENRVFDDEIEFAFDGEGIGTQKYVDLFNKTDNSYYFTLSGQSDKEIKLAGDYVITLNLDQTIFDKDNFGDGFKFFFNVVVNKATLVVTEEDIQNLKVAEKLYGDSDPEFANLEKVMYEETVVFTLVRQSGESRGRYPFTEGISHNDNYTIKISDGLSFEIKALDVTLKVKVNDKLEKVYDKLVPKFILDFSGTWTVMLGDTASGVELSYQSSSGSEVVLAVGSTMYQHALEFLKVYGPSDQVGNYQTVSYEGDAAFVSYQFIINYEITQREIRTTEITKVFDRTKTILQEGVVYENLCEGDELFFVGEYVSPLAGEVVRINIETLRLEGGDAANYKLGKSYFGKITPYVINEDQRLSLDVTTYVYGQVYVGMDLTVLTNGGVNFSIGDVNDDLANGFVAISAITIDSEYLSTAQYLKAGNDMLINVIVTSTNFEGLATSGYEVRLTINPKELDLSYLSSIITKKYDTTTALKLENTKIDANLLLPNDDVSIDVANSSYESPEVGEKKVTLALTGVDAGNYNPIQNVTGKITSYIIEVTIVADKEHADLVPTGNFVEDGKSPTGKLNFNLSYPIEADLAFSTLEYPTRDGYTAIAWRYRDNDSADEKYIALNNDNINEVLRYSAEENDEQLTLYVEWSINSYTIGITGDFIKDYTITSLSDSGVSGDKENGYKLEYYTSVRIEFEAEKGYKLQKIAGVILNAVESDLEDSGNTMGEATLTQITGENILRLTFVEIEITFEIDTNIPDFTERRDTKETSFAVPYSQLAEKELPELLVTDGTYLINDFSYMFEESELMLGDMGLDELIDKLFPELVEDKIVQLKAQWKGVNYIIRFDPTEGSLDGQLDTVEAVFGEQLPPLPVPVCPGKEATWVYLGDKTEYQTGTRLSSIGNPATDHYELVLTAQWVNVPHDITINFDEKLEIYINNEMITSGRTYRLVFNVDILTIEIRYKTKGYTFSYTEIPGTVERNVDIVYISNLTADCEITFNSIPNPYQLSIYTDDTVAEYEIIVYNAPEDVAKQEKNSPQIEAVTGQIVVVKFTSRKGYEFDLTQNLIFSGDCKPEYELESDGKVLKFTWKGFAEAASLSVKAVPGDINISFDDISFQFYNLKFNNKNIELTGGTFVVKTGSTLVISGSLNYGYEGGDLTTGDVNYVVEGSVKNEYNTQFKRYLFEAQLAGYDEDFKITFTMTPRQYKFSLSTQDPALGELSAGIDAIQNVNYGEALKVGQTELEPTYRFIGWYIGEARISTVSNCELILGRDIMQSHLDTADEDGFIYVVAMYELKTLDEKFSVTGKGYITVTQDENFLDVHSDEQVTFRITQGKDIVITLVPDNGYVIDKLIFDGVEKTPANYGYDENNILTIPIDLYDPVKSIEISFKAGEATIIVQAGTLISNIKMVGTTAGGSIFITDSEGTRLEENVYKPYKGDLIVGGSYTIDSHTDEVLYFILESNEGFTSNVITTQGASINAVTKNGILVYAILGLKDGYQIEAIFTAKENTVNIHFEVEGQDDLISAGRVEVDTSSNLIKSTPRNSFYANVGIISGENLVFNLYIYPSFRFEVENNVVKYRIVYGSEDQFGDGNIKVGEVKPCDIATTGFISMVSFTVENVTTDAEIIFYVIPKEYSINFKVLDDSPAIEMSQKIIYGQQWSLNNLPADEKGRILATRPNFSFIGYFTKPSANGEIVIDRYGEVLDAWRFSGYSPNGLGVYVADENYDPENDTFTLYAAWTYDTADIQIQFVPQNVVIDNPGYTIESIVTNLHETDAWTGQDSNWQARIAVGSNLKISAINFVGYVFDKFTLQFGNSEPIVKPASFTLNLEMGVYILTAYYKPAVTITIVNTNNDLADGGTAYARQNGNNIEDCYDSQVMLSIIAKPNEGYNFIKWQILENGIYVDLIGKGSLNASGEYVYDFPTLRSDAISLIAYFEGKPIALTFDDSEIKDFHQILSKQLDGFELDSNETTAHVGDIFTVEIYKLRGYNFNLENTGLTIKEINKDVYTFECRFTYDILEDVDGTSYKKVIKIGLAREEMSFYFTYFVQNPIDDGENTRGGYVTIGDASGNILKIENEGQYKNTYGNNFAINIVTNKNYRLESLYLKRMIENIGIQGYDITAYLDQNGQIIFNKSLMDRFFEYQIYIEATFIRLQWDDSEIIDSLYTVEGEGEDAYVVASFSGSGTEEDPFIISSAKEFALMSYLVNNGLKNNVGEKYSELYYVVVNNIDFEGRFWVPIGTGENPFDGFIDLGKNDFYNVEHFTTYTNPPTSHSGLFWHIGEKGKVEEDRSTLVIILLSIFIPLLILIIILIIILILRKKKKDELEDISNQ